VCMFLGRNTLLTFEESSGDVFDTIRQRLKTKDSRLRRSDISMLCHALLEAIVEHLFPILEEYTERLERLERAVLSKPRPNTIKKIHRVKRELLMLRRAAWPMRELINQLQREPRECLPPTTQVYLRDIYNHITQIIDLLETYRDFATGLTETYMSAASHRMNEIMKILTIISTIFVPLTFLAGVYGMNMPIPENQSPWTYPIFWGFSLTVATCMLFWF